MEVLPIPPAPSRAMGVKFSTRPTIFPMRSLRPKQALGGGGGDSPRWMLENRQIVDLALLIITDLAWIYGTVSALLSTNGEWKSHLPSVGRSRTPDLPSCDAYPQQVCEY